MPPRLVAEIALLFCVCVVFTVCNTCLTFVVCCVLFERCVLWLIVVTMSPGKNPFAVQLNNNDNNNS
jgi:hypothetical protein